MGRLHSTIKFTNHSYITYASWVNVGKNITTISYVGLSFP